ncbi:MAG TPA: RnfABCDGE type electron transport complex subunit D [bacterium]|nr:RnfABCDGE type electron transport complex subunit D [bacterium]
MSNTIVSLSPHAKGPLSTEKVMWGVVIALLPSFAFSAYFFGIRAIVVTLVATIACILTEFVIQKYLMRTTVTAFDGSAAITGILLAFNVPSSIPIWQMVLGAVFAIAIGKMVFGGLGRNPFNPALLGRAFMLASFPVDMTTWPIPVKTQWLWEMGKKVDGTTAATPLGFFKEGIKMGGSMGDLVAQRPELYDYFNLFIGNVGGCIGEVSSFAILLGGIYLLYKKIITWHIPVFYLGGLALITGIFWWMEPAKYADPLFHLFAGGAMLGAWFMATDMVTSPMTVKGQILFAVCGGLLCGLIRLFGAFPEGCSYSILIMNAFVPLIDKYIKPTRFGKEVNYG